MPERAELRPLVAPRKAEPPSVHAEKQNDGKQLGLSHDARTVVKEEDEPTQAWLNKGLSTGSDESPCPVPLSRFCSLSMLSSEISMSYTDSVIDARPAPEPFGLKRQHDLSVDVYGRASSVRQRRRLSTPLVPLEARLPSASIPRFPFAPPPHSDSHATRVAHGTPDHPHTAWT